MPITRKIYRKGEQPMPLTAEQLAEINALKGLNDADIDHSDDQATKAGWIQASLEKIKSTPFALEPKHLTHL
ncbi:hypothetical protein ABCS71_003880, partial [Acinetobacter baumannii]